MTHEQKHRWRQMRRLGKTRFVWTRGVLGWGLVCALTATFLFVAIHPGGPIGLATALFALGFPLGGYFWGRTVWDAMERRYDALRTH